MENFVYKIKNKENINFVIKDILEKINVNQNIVIACIGTDKVIGDSYGPFVGTLLKEINLKNTIIYGTLKDPIHALNAKEKIKEIYSKHFNDFIIGIDACLSDDDDIYILKYRDIPIRPGKGMGKTLGEIGNVSIVCPIGKGLYIDNNLLARNRLSDIYRMAKHTVSMIKTLDELFTKEKILNCAKIKEVQIC